MKFVLDFIEIYAQGLFYLWPIFAVLVGFIVALGLRIGALEGWEPHDAVLFRLHHRDHHQLRRSCTRPGTAVEVAGARHRADRASSSPA